MLRGRALIGDGDGPSGGHGLQSRALVGRIALDRLHQVGDQVVATPQLGLDVRPGVVDVLALLHEAVVRDHADDDDEEQHDRDDQEDDHLSTVGGAAVWRRHLTGAPV